MLYTIVSVDDIFDEPEERTFVAASFQGINLIVEPVGDGRARVERILSTDPEHFLRADLAPGSIVRLP